jgi:hypothetical protein
VVAPGVLRLVADREDLLEERHGRAVHHRVRRRDDEARAGGDRVVRGRLAPGGRPTRRRTHRARDQRDGRAMGKARIFVGVLAGSRLGGRTPLGYGAQKRRQVRGARAESGGLGDTFGDLGLCRDDGLLEEGENPFGGEHPSIRAAGNLLEHAKLHKTTDRVVCSLPGNLVQLGR